jgi:hypothetical protein
MQQTTTDFNTVYYAICCYLYFFFFFFIPQDPLKEVAVMQYLSTAGGHVNILGITEAVKDENAVRCAAQRFSTVSQRFY